MHMEQYQEEISRGLLRFFRILLYTLCVWGIGCTAPIYNRLFLLVFGDAMTKRVPQRNT